MIYCTDSHHRHSAATGGVALFCQAAEFTSNKLLSQTWLFLLTFNEVGENDHNRSIREFDKILWRVSLNWNIYSLYANAYHSQVQETYIFEK